MTITFYAYVPVQKDGSEPFGTHNRLIIRDLKTNAWAIRRAIKMFGDKCVVYRTPNFYDESTYIKVK